MGHRRQADRCEDGMSFRLAEDIFPEAVIRQRAGRGQQKSQLVLALAEDRVHITA
jgi:hypothetical protein